MMSRQLRDMVVVITGASSGIGAAVARDLAARGARLVLAARRVDRLQSLNREWGGSHLVVPTDVIRQSDCERLVARTIEHFGRLDTLICNAGYGIHRTVAESSPDDLREIFQTNVFGTTDCIRAAVPHLLRQEPRNGYRGQIMIVTSAVARRGIPFFGAYAATKAAQLSLAEAMRVELHPQQIAVTTVHPIGTETEFGDASAARSQGRRPWKIKGEVRQSAQAVSRKMVRAIERPRPEAWPFAPSRWALSAATLVPSWVDRVLNARRGDMQCDR